VEPVAVEIGQPQLRGGRPRPGPRAVVPLEAARGHLVDAGEGAGGPLEEAGAHPVPHPLVLGLHEPVAAVLQLLYPRDQELPLRGRLAGPEVGREIGEVDVVGAGDEPLEHERPPWRFGEAPRGAIVLPETSPGQAWPETGGLGPAEPPAQAVEARPGSRSTAAWTGPRAVELVTTGGTPKPSSRSCASRRRSQSGSGAPMRAASASRRRATGSGIPAPGRSPSGRPQTPQASISRRLSAARSLATLAAMNPRPTMPIRGTPQVSGSIAPARVRCQTSPATRKASRGTSAGSKAILKWARTRGASSGSRRRHRSPA